MTTNYDAAFKVGPDALWLLPDGSPTDPQRLLHSAAGKLAKAQLACQSIDPDIVGARGAVEYVVALARAVQDDLRQALAVGLPDDGGPDGPVGERSLVSAIDAATARLG